MTTRTYCIGCGLLVAVALILLILPQICVMLIIHFNRPSVYRLPFPAAKRLTEQDALELSKQALILDGKRTDTMRPVYSGHKDSEGREIYFLRNRDNPDKGSVLWWLEKPDYTWEYSVGITKEGDEVVCSIYNPL